MTRIALRVLCAAVLAGTVGCDDNTPACVPRTTEFCYCATGDPGQRVCDTNGLGYGPCDCLPDAGVATTDDDLAAAGD